jgi:hypothetical protein
VGRIGRISDHLGPGGATRRLLPALGLLAAIGCAAARTEQVVTPVPTTPAALQGYAVSLLHAEAAARELGGRAEYLSTGQAPRTRAALLDTIAPPASLAALHSRLLDAARQMAALGPRAATVPATGVVPCYGPSPVASASCGERNLQAVGNVPLCGRAACSFAAEPPFIRRPHQQFT